MGNNHSQWFCIEEIDNETFAISEYKHWEETHCYLLIGTEKCLLIDTGLGIENIYDEVRKITNKPVTAVATHTHWDHIGGHKYFPNFYVHKDETDWISGNFPLTLDFIKNLVIQEPCDFPKSFDIEAYQFFQGTPTKVLVNNDCIDIGGRTIDVLHTPGHAPGHMCFFEQDRNYLYTGDLVYIGKLTAFFPSTDPLAYMNSIERIALLPVKKILPAHHNMNVPISIINDVKNAFEQLYTDGLLKHGSGTFYYNNFAIQL